MSEKETEKRKKHLILSVQYRTDHTGSSRGILLSLSDLAKHATISVCKDRRREIG